MALHKLGMSLDGDSFKKCKPHMDEIEKEVLELFDEAKKLIGGGDNDVNS